MPLVSELQAMTDDYIENRQPLDVYFKSNVLLYKLLSRGDTYSGGKRIQSNLEYGKSNSGSYGPTSELPINKTEILTAAYFTYAAYYATLTADMEDDIINSGPEQIVDIVLTKLKNAEKTLRDTMASAIFGSRAAGILADPKSKPFLGLEDLFNQSDDFAYGEIKPTDLVREDGSSMWKAAQITDAKTMSFKFMQELRREASIDTTREGKPDLYLTTETLQDAYERSQQVQVRYSDKNLLNAGFDNVLFKGAAVVADNKQEEGYIDAFNMRYLKIKTHSKRNFTKPVWQSPIRQPDTMTANIRWAGQFICSNRNAHARATNVSEPA
jgi:hypothetical protein